MALFPDVQIMNRSSVVFGTLFLCIGLAFSVPTPLAAPSQTTRIEPPKETGKALRNPDLVELIRLDSTIHLDIHYAREDNFMKRRMYDTARAFLQRPAAEAVVRVQKKLRAQGIGLVIFDAYRPWSVTKQFWDETPPSQALVRCRSESGLQAQPWMRGGPLALRPEDRPRDRDAEQL